MGIGRSIDTIEKIDEGQCCCSSELEDAERNASTNLVSLQFLRIQGAGILLCKRQLVVSLIVLI